MTGDAASALLQMSTCISYDGATHWARLAQERGATVEELKEAWRLWEQLQGESVQVIQP